MYKDLVDLLVAYGSWTATPTIKQVTQTPEDLLEYVKDLDADGVLLVMPPRVTNTFTDGYLSRTYTFKVYIYRHGFAGPDTGMDQYETLWENLDACLKASALFDDNYCEEWSNMTDRRKNFCFGMGTITVEDWVA